MDFKAIRSHIAEMNKSVASMKKETFFEGNDLAKEYARTFDASYKAAQAVLKAPKGEFVDISKESKLETLYEDLKGWYTGLAVIQNSSAEQVNVLKKVPKIKEEKPKTRQRKKKVTKIKDPNQSELPIRGGARAGAGRKSIGVKKHMALTMPQQMWDEIDNLIQKDGLSSYSEFFRQLVHGIVDKKK
ncbi:hypothetical protein [Paenibacillus sp. CGMCC 1.18879]|uniref:hypothetical protein n=1 Tax=Paenibacillus sp. CGMCC 1.18879 TaxID=2834466 RepID=UPI001CA80C0C|nr:hypothetical protein [Paenibacillus sp. CGMCC 1.18879]MBY9082358.1 hypothetical protein [Paenibacillus sp. CGMCC 1.18879]